MGLGSLMIQRISRAFGQKDVRGVNLYFFNGLLLQLIFMSLLLGGAAITASWVPVWFQANINEAGPLKGCFLLAAVAMAFSILNNGAASLSQSLQRPLFMTVATATCTLAGLLATIALLFWGWGLWAIPSGLMVRNVFLFSANLLYSLWLVSRSGVQMRYDKAIMSDLIRLSPALFASKFGSGLVGSIEPTLITIVFQPELAAAFAITKRVVDMIKMVLDRFAGAVFSGFSHLYAQGEIRKAADVACQVLMLLFGAGLAFMGAYVVGNASFVGLWVGASHFAGQNVTNFISIAVFIAVVNNLLSYLLGAMGDIVKPALLIFAEAVLRIVLMVSLLPFLGVVGLPMGMIVSSLSIAFIFYKRFGQRLGTTIYRQVKPIRFICCFLIIGGSAVLLPHFVVCSHWWQLIAFIAGFLIASGLVVLLFYYPVVIELLPSLKHQKN
jgi:O-antigen/teichoic acid export membrane protein